MRLAAGTRLGPYEIVSPIGKGGMGEVYRAHDTKLERDVAIKVLPDELAADEERVARFEREAKLLASLNHPNIASIYGLEESDGVKSLVLELVEGPTLAERIAEGPIPVDETIATAKQIAEALEAGHEAGVIHRDLKPGNIKLKEDGTVKVLDYGLAKALEDNAIDGADPDLSHSPTLTRQGTQLGMILGTAAYMSPEQAKGKPVDKRTDNWAFGAVVYEMLTGEPAFPGEDISETLASVIKTEPAWSRLPAGTPVWLRKLLRRCLEKDRSKRLRDIGDALLDWNERSDDPPQGERSNLGRLYAFSALVALVAGFLGWSLKPSVPGNDSTTLSRFSINLPRDQELSMGDSLRAPPFAIAPDGRSIAYVATESGVRRLYLRALDTQDAERIEDTDGALSPFFSPDGEWVGYFAEDRLQKVSLMNRLPITICDVFGEPVGGTWSEDGFIVFASGRASGLFRVPAQGGEPSPLTTVNASANELGHLWPFIVDERVVYTVRRNVGFDFAIASMDLSTGESGILVEGARSAIVTRGGYLVYGTGAIHAAPLDAVRGTLTGPAVRLPLDAYTSPGGGAMFVAVSGFGDLVYFAPPSSQLAWVDRNGRFEPVPGIEWKDGDHVRLSPEGERLATNSQIFDLERGTTHRIWSEASIYPVWRPGSYELAVFMLVDGLEQLFSVGADGGRPPTRLLESEVSQVPNRR